MVLETKTDLSGQRLSLLVSHCLSPVPTQTEPGTHLVWNDCVWNDFTLLEREEIPQYLTGGNQSPQRQVEEEEGKHSNLKASTMSVCVYVYVCLQM